MPEIRCRVDLYCSLVWFCLVRRDEGCRMSKSGSVLPCARNLQLKAKYIAKLLLGTYLKYYCKVVNSVLRIIFVKKKKSLLKFTINIIWSRWWATYWSHLAHGTNFHDQISFWTESWVGGWTYLPAESCGKRKCN